MQFQFQDRIGQTLAHVRENIDLFPTYLAHSQVAGAQELRPLDAEALLAELQGSYVMKEEHFTHSTGRAAHLEASEITFF